MHTLKVVLWLAAVMLVAPAYAQRTEPDDRYRISLVVDGAPIQGGQERAARIAGKTEPERRAVLDEPAPTLRSKQSFQLVVKVTDPSGKVVDYSKSNRLIYEDFGCLTVSRQGFVTVIATDKCVGPPDFPALLIVFTDSKGDPVTFNDYLFRVVP